MRLPLVMFGLLSMAALVACASENISSAERAEKTKTDTAPSATEPAPAEAPTLARDAGADASPEADAGTTPASLRSHFECKDLGGSAFRPYWLQAISDADGGAHYKDYGARGQLGQNAMTSRAECDRARAVASDAHGVICSRTGLDGWKPTLYTGTVPGRADFGYLGGSSITKFEDCLTATENSSAAGVCFWGGSAWYVSPIDREGTTSGPYASIDACVTQTRR